MTDIVHLHVLGELRDVFRTGPQQPHALVLPVTHLIRQSETRITDRRVPVDVQLSFARSYFKLGDVDLEPLEVHRPM